MARQNDSVSGRFAPSPTGDLHLGNLRTALAAWLDARSADRTFIVRIEDLDRATSSPDHERSQLADLATFGLRPDAPVVRQSERFDLYRDAIATLAAIGAVYRCYCTRREIRAEIDAAASAPNGPLLDSAYPGTCRELPAARRVAYEAEGRTPALRLRTDQREIVIDDRLVGPWRGRVDDVVLQRRDGVPAYNLAVVVDDAEQAVTSVVRGDDLLASTPRQVLLQQMLGLPTPSYLHVPLVLGADGQRLAKRHGAVTLRDLAAAGWTSADVLSVLAASLGVVACGEPVALDALVDRFRPSALPRQPVTLGELHRLRP
jgi:glutamyl-tRNA synthetase